MGQLKMYFPIENGDIPAIAMLVYQRVLLMEDILYQLYGKYTIIYKVSYVSGGAGFLLSTVCLEQMPGTSQVTSELALLELCKSLYTHLGGFFRHAEERQEFT